MGILPTTTGGRIEVINGGGAAGRTFPHAADAAVAKFHIIEARLDGSPSHVDRALELQEDFNAAKADVAAYIQRANGAPDAAELARLQERADRRKRALETHHQLTRTTTAIRAAFQGTRDATLRYINSNHGRKLVEVATEIPKGASFESLSTKVADLGVNIRETDEGWPPLGDALEEARARIESLAARGAPRASVDVEPNGNPLRPTDRAVLNLRFPQMPLPAAPLNDGDELLTVFDGVAAMCWLHRDAILAKVEKDIRAAYGAYEGPTLSESDRRRQVAALRAQRLQVERQLAALIWERIDGGDTLVTFPADMAPEAILGVTTSG